MEEYVVIFFSAILNSIIWVWKSIAFKVNWFENYFWGLIIISIIVWFLEIQFPWRKDQKLIRKDFWLDVFYMFFNFFLFSIIVAGVYAILGLFFNNLGIELSSIALIDLKKYPSWVQLFIFFIVLDFVQWVTHVALHRYPWLWTFHKVHHSVEQMGFAAHLRYHWMENIFYKPLKTFGVMLLGGFEPSHAYIVHFIAITIGHLNHSNVKWSWGPLKYVLNSPLMHIWHHAYHLPSDRNNGVNFGISLSLWDYIFKTNYMPHEGKNIKLGFPGIENFPKTFLNQILYGFKKNKL